MLNTKWQIGDSLRVTRNVRDDGTFPGAFRGDLLVRRGRVGHVVDIGTFLFDQIIYSLHFVEEDRVVACREEELIGLDEHWVDSRFETRDKVSNQRALAIGGEVRVPVGAIGEILKVLRDTPGEVCYHVHFDCYAGHTLAVRESALAPAGALLEEEKSHV